jgi:hypothetical protein
VPGAEVAREEGEVSDTSRLLSVVTVVGEEALAGAMR